VSPAPDFLDIDGLLGSLKAAGLRPRVQEPSLFLSIPDSALVLAGDDRIGAWPATFARSTGGEDVQGPLQAVDPHGTEPLAGAVAVIDGAVTPDAAYAVERRGAVAQIFISPADPSRPRSCSTIWGAPTHESIARKPRTPVVSVDASERGRLGKAIERGRVARVSAELREGWMPAPVVAVDIPGPHEREEFVLVHGSDDDVLLDVARACHAARGELARTVRVAWWPDRSLGSAVGSSWFADAYANEIDRWCVAHVSVGGDAVSDAYWMAEAAELALESIVAAGIAAPRGRRPPREANYSFNQIGVTGLFGGHAFPAPVYAHAVVHIAKASIYPFDYTAPLLEMGAAVQRYQAAAGNEMDFAGVSQDLARLRRAIGAWRSDADADLRRHQSDTTVRRRVNATLRALARVLVPLGFARGERFDHDPAIQFSALPRLEAALHVAEAGEPLRSFIRTALLRETNKVQARLRHALALIT
jgi:hypothetical protein